MFLLFQEKIRRQLDNNTIDMELKFKDQDKTIKDLTIKNAEQTTKMNEINKDLTSAKEQQSKLSKKHETDISDLNTKIDGLNYHRPGN